MIIYHLCQIVGFKDCSQVTILLAVHERNMLNAILNLWPLNQDWEGTWVIKHLYLLPTFAIFRATVMECDLPLSSGVIFFTMSTFCSIIYASDFFTSIPFLVHLIVLYTVVLQVSVRFCPGYIWSVLVYNLSATETQSSLRWVFFFFFIINAIVAIINACSYLCQILRNIS